MREVGRALEALDVLDHGLDRVGKRFELLVERMAGRGLDAGRHLGRLHAPHGALGVVQNHDLARPEHRLRDGEGRDGVVGMNVDEWVYELIELADRVGARRIVIDSLPDVEIATGDPIRFREWIFSLTQRFTRAGVSLMLIIEVPELFQLERISEQGISHLADNVILLQYVQEGAELARALTLLKTRAQEHRPVVHRYEITDHGFVLGDVLTVRR